MSIQREFSIDGPAELDVRVQAGRVEVVEGKAGKVRVTVDATDSDFTVEQRGNRIVVAPVGNSSWLTHGSAYVVIEAPQFSDAVISTTSARVESQLRLERIEVKTASGDVAITSAESAEVKTASGDTRIGRTEKILRFKSASGDLFVTDCCEGISTVSSASGDVHIAESGAVTEVNTVSGDVFVPHFRGQKANVKSMSGDIRLGIPAGTSVDLDASLLSGNLHLPPATEETPPTRRHMTVKAKLVSGDLRIDRLDSAD